MSEPCPIPSRPPASAEVSRLRIVCERPEDFGLLLQAGFGVELPEGLTVREFLCEHMEICGEYAEKRLQTIFLDGSAVDKLDETLLGPGSCLALSGAMPGLVGATMRRGGYYGRMREGITSHLLDQLPERDPFLATVKLFNFIGPELAGQFLARGVYLPRERLLDFLCGPFGDVLAACREAELDGGPLSDVASLRRASDDLKGLVLLSVVPGAA